MALGARCGGVLASERKFGCIVIELGAQPLRGGVAELAVLREASGGVVRVLGRLEVGQVARVAGRAEGGVLSVGMALSARGGGVFASQRKLGCIVIELGAQPLRGRVAELAALRVTGRNMIRAGSGLIVLQMTRHAVGAQRRILPVGVTLGTRRGGVLAGQRKLRGAVIEGRAKPLRGGVAELAVLWEAGRQMIGSCSGLIVL